MCFVKDVQSSLYIDVNLRIYSTLNYFSMFVGLQCPIQFNVILMFHMCMGSKHGQVYEKKIPVYKNHNFFGQLLESSKKVLLKLDIFPCCPLLLC